MSISQWASFIVADDVLADNNKINFFDVASKQVFLQIKVKQILQHEKKSIVPF